MTGKVKNQSIKIKYPFIFSLILILAFLLTLSGPSSGRERKSGHNGVFGLDGQLRINQCSIFGFHFPESQTKFNKESAKDGGHALELNYLHSTRNWALKLGPQDIAEDFCYYGYYANISRGRRQKENQDGVIPYILEQEENSKEYRRNWVKLIQKIYEVYPPT